MFSPTAIHPTGHFDARGDIGIYGGLTLFVGATIFELVDTLRVLRRHHVSITPMANGLAFGGTF